VACSCFPCPAAARIYTSRLLPCPTPCPPTLQCVLPRGSPASRPLSHRWRCPLPHGVADGDGILGTARTYLFSQKLCCHPSVHQILLVPSKSISEGKIILPPYHFISRSGPDRFFQIVSRPTTSVFIQLWSIPKLPSSLLPQLAPALHLVDCLPRSLHPRSRSSLPKSPASCSVPPPSPKIIGVFEPL